ncbi:MAG: FHA domain-containing protein [candidate division Zixibacteria bacterium]
MPARLFCKTGPLAGSSFQISDEATIGKSSSNVIVLPADVVSGTHARIYLDSQSGRYILEDLNSRNGTKLDGIRVTDKEKLDRLNVITFAGKFDFIFQTADKFSLEVKRTAPPPPPPAAKPPTPEPSKTPPANVAEKTIADVSMGGLPAGLGQPPGETKAADKTMLEQGMGGLPSALAKIDDQQKETEDDKSEEKTMLDAGGELPAGLPSFGTPPSDSPKVDDEATVGMSAAPPAAPQKKYQLQVKDSGKQFNLKEGENIVGRSMECTVVINSESLSRRHAAITISAKKITIKDLGSSNHTFVDGDKIDAEREISAGSKLKFGNIEATIVEG